MIRRRTYLSINLHLVWATHNRLPLLTEDIETKVYDYFAAVARKHRCDVLAIGGTENHVHLFLTFPATLRLMDLVRDLKGGSSRFVQAQLKPKAWFDWQDNYGAFSVSSGHRQRTIDYIKNQRQHHTEGTLEVALERDSIEYETDDIPGDASDR